MDVMVGREFGKSLPAELRGFGGDGYGRLLANGTAMQSGPGSAHRLAGLGITAQEIASLIQSSSQATLPLIVADNPGTMLQVGPNGQLTVYHQPTGTTANLPVGTQTYLPAGSGGVMGGGAAINTPFGSASFAGLSGSTLMLAGVGLIAVLLLSRK